VFLFKIIPGPWRCRPAIRLTAIPVQRWIILVFEETILELAIDRKKAEQEIRRQAHSA